MTRRQKIWQGAAALFTFINVAGAIVAARAAETMHCAIHVALAVLSLYVVQRIAVRARREELEAQQALAGFGHADPKLEYLQQSVDAIALEVERLGEAQRYNAKVQAEQSEKGR
jgi:hypothetical protein